MATTDSDLNALEALLDELRFQSAAVLIIAEKWFAGDAEALSKVHSLLAQLARVAEVARLDAAMVLADAVLALLPVSGPRPPDPVGEGIAHGLVSLNALLVGIRAGDAAPLSELLPELRRLRRLSGLSPAVPFSAPAAGTPAQSVVAAKVRDPAKGIFTMLRRTGDRKPPVESLRKLVRTLERAGPDAGSVEVWWLAGLLLDVAAASPESLDAPRRRLLADLEPMFEAVAAGNSTAGEIWIGRAIASLAALSDRSGAVDDALVRYGYTAAMDGSRRGATADPAEAARRVLTGSARAELDRVRDGLDMFMRGGGGDAALLKPSAESLARVGAAPPAAAALIADSLIHVDQVLHSGVGGPAETMLEGAVQALAQVALEVLHQVRPSLLEAVELDATSGLAAGAENMRQVAAALNVAELEELSALVGEAASALAAASLGAADLSALAEALVCLELCLAAVRDGQPAEVMLEQAWTALSRAPAVQEGRCESEEPEPPVVTGTADPEMLAVYLEEAHSHITVSRQALVALRENAVDANARQNLQRAVHTLKGSGRMVGAMRLAEFSWNVEALLKRLEHDPSPLGDAQLEVLAGAVAVLPLLLEQLESGADPDLDLAVIRRALADPDKVADRFTDTILRSTVSAQLAIVGRWLDSLATGTGSGRVPQAVMDALSAATISADTLGVSRVAGLSCELRDWLSTAFDINADERQQIVEQFEQLQKEAAGLPGEGRDSGAIDSFREEAGLLLDRMGDTCDALSEVAHQTENMLRAVGDERKAVTPRLLWMLQRLFDAMYGILEMQEAEMSERRAMYLLEELRQLSSDDRSVPKTPSGDERFHKPRVTGESERVRSDQFDHALVRSLSLVQRSAQMESCMGDQSGWNMATIASMLKSLTEDAAAIRDALIRARTAPLHLHADRWSRVVKQTAEDVGRECEIRFEGLDVEVDRRLLDALLLPMEHLLHNAIVHGIEPAAARADAGKPLRGVVTLRSSIDEDGVVIEVEDDGAGIDVNKVRAKARERGIEVPEDDLTDDLLLSLISTPGLSTTDAVTRFSGFDIGVDAVAETVSELGGKVQLHTMVGRGTCFVIQLPNPSPVMTVELLRVGIALLAVPIQSLVVTRAAGPDDEVVEHEGESWPFAELASLIGIVGARAAIDAGTAVLLRHVDQGVALRVDEVLGRVEIAVHRPQGGDIQENACITGVGLLDGGRLCTVLSMEVVLHSTQSVRIRPLAVIADDSATARDEVHRKLERAGFRVLAGEDGTEARRLLSRHKPVLVVLDIDMPGHDGLELLEWSRTRPSLKEVPVIMVCAALDGPRRERAAAFGAIACVEKPFSGSSFDDVVAKVFGAD